MENNLEKILFIQMTWKQFGKLNEEAYFNTIKLLSDEEKKLSTKLNSELHDIYNRVNVSFIDKINIHSIQEYNEVVAPVSKIILKVSTDFGLTLKGEASEELKQAIRKILGQEYLDDFLKSINL